VYTSDAKSRYERTLLREIRAHEWEWLPETLYFGGGTPSLMPISFLTEMTDLIPKDRLGETTWECAPGTITEDAARAWHALGINRVSLGVQSFVTAELRRTGRRHTADVVERDVHILRNAGVSNINIDLIAGLPGQTTESWNDSLQWIERLRPPHVSVYVFEADEDSRLGSELLLGGSRYGANTVPSEDLTAEFYERAVGYLARIGIYRYEISNFAVPGWESRHNLKYWQGEPYVGFGLDAHSFDGHRRWGNPESLLEYLEGRFRPSEPTISDLAEEHFFVGLRLSAGIEPTPEEWSRFKVPINRWLDAGMLERVGPRLRLTDRGVLVSNEILQEFVNV
jgi:oxygen-independent coproporphyrinogen-3 oxidase